MKQLITTIALTIVFSPFALAHGKETHVMGTVANIAGNTITVATVAKRSVAVDVSDQTKFEKSGTPAALNDLQVGDKVVIHAEKEGDKLIAHQVRFGTMSNTSTKGIKSKADSHPATTNPRQ